MRQAFRELRAELVNVRTVVAWRRARVVLAMGRQKLAAAQEGADVLVRTVRGVGYCIKPSS